MKTRPFSPGADALIGVVHHVLDHGEVELVDYMGTDEHLCKIARVSTGSERQHLGLLGYLVRHKHNTPIEFGKLTLRVKIPWHLAQQWLRHRTGAFSVHSHRYQPPISDCYIPSEEYIQSRPTEGVKQGRGATMTEGDAQWVRKTVAESAESALALYSALVEEDGGYSGLAAEVARIVLPQGQYTQFYWVTDAHNLMHFLNLRLDPHAQKEIRAYADIVYKIFCAWLPALAQAFDTYVRGAVTFSAKEAAALAKVGLNACLVGLGDYGMSAGEIAEFTAKLQKLK